MPATNTAATAICASMVWTRDRWPTQSQCSRKAGHGPDGQYCRQHAEAFASEVIAVWYKTDDFSYRVQPVDVLKETADKLLISTSNGPRTEAKLSRYDRYWPTREAAIEHLEARLESKRQEVREGEIAIQGLKQSSTA